MLIAATFNRGKYMYKSREGGCATAEQKHRTERESQRDLPSSSHSALYSGSNLFGLFPKNKSSMSVPTFVGFHGGWWIMIINIFITIQYCGFMQTSGSSGGESVVVFKEKILSIKSLLKREKKMLKHHRYAHEF